MFRGATRLVKAKKGQARFPAGNVPLFARGSKAQVAVEFMLVLAIGAMIFLISLLTFQQGVGGIKSASGATRFVNSLESLFDAADSLQTGSQEYVQLSIPPGLSGFEQVGAGGGWYIVTFQFNGQTWSRRVPYKLTFIPPNFDQMPGERTALIYANNPGDVVVQIIS